MNEHARPIFQHRIGGERKVPLFEGHCKASVSTKPNAFDV